MASKQRELLKAQALRDKGKAEQFSEDLTPEGRREYYLLSMALFAGTVSTRLGDEPSRDDIDTILKELRYDFRDSEGKVNFLHIEGAIRALYGEEDLLDSIAKADQTKAFMAVIMKIVHQNDDVRNRLDDYLTEAEKLVEVWKRA